LLSLAAPWNYLLYTLQLAGYGLAAIGPRLDGTLGRVAYLPRFLWDSNVAAVRGLARLASGRQSPLWVRVTRREAPSEVIPR
jgi:hypothetical protein